jgi:hypothetical protein
MNSKLLALGALKRFHGEREKKNESGLKISNWQE